MGSGVAHSQAVSNSSPSTSVLAPQPKPPRTTPADVTLLPGPKSLPVTGVFMLAFRLRGGQLAQYSEFPELDGFKKSGKTSTTTTRTPKPDPPFTAKAPPTTTD